MAQLAETPLPRLIRLRAFENVAAAGAMSAAAARLHVTQPAVTRAMGALEQEIGARLFERGRGGSFLTPEGQIFARRTRRFFQQMTAALADAVGADPQDDAVARLARKLSDVHVRSLVAISKAQSFRAAAKMLNIAEPTLHRPARNLERLLKTPLFRRTLDGIALSPTGSELARRFSLGAVEIKAGIDELAARHGAGATTMAMGVLVLAPKRPLAIVAEEVLRRHPKSRVAIREGSYDELVGAMRRGSIDLIFGALRSPPPFGDLHEEIWFDDPYCVVCRRDHPLTRLPRPTRADLRRYDWIFATPALPRRAVLDQIIIEWNLSTRVQIETNSLGAVISALAVSDRISLLPREYVLVEDRSDLLAVLNVRVPHRPRMVGLTTRLDWLPTAFQSEVISLLRTTSRERGHRASGADNVGLPGPERQA
jgi:LysR family transcriptional regulator, regulator for genes of the gallate degradation pathway